MLTKAILTGGVLSVLAGSIVYFGTEGADALERDIPVDARMEDTDLAGGIDVAVGETDVSTSNGVAKVAANDPQVKDDKPKTKWLDQYLKRNKADETAEPKPKAIIQDNVEPSETTDKLRSDIRTDAKGTTDIAKGSYIVSETERDITVETRDLDSVQDDVGEMFGLALAAPKVDYDVVIEQAEKLLVVDMRDQAMLEILDYAIAKNDMTIAADLIEKLSSPELRDTGRSRLGKGLALRGKTDAAFAVLDEIEIDELAAPIRLEIITALMMTQEERMMRLYQRN